MARCFWTTKVDLLAHDPDIRRSISDNFRNKIDCFCWYISYVTYIIAAIYHFIWSIFLGRQSGMVAVQVDADPLSLQSEFKPGILTTLILNGWLPNEWITVGTFISIWFPPIWDAVPDVAIDTGTKVLPDVKIWLPVPSRPPFMIWKVFSASFKTIFSPLVGLDRISNSFS